MLPMLPHDKANHALYGYAAFVCGVLLGPLAGLDAFAAGAVLCSALAFGKEVYDKVSGKGTPDAWDVVATTAGAIPAAIAVLLL